MRIQEQHKLTNRTTRPDNTVIEVAGSQVRIGGNEAVIMAGPCSVESCSQIIESALAVKAAGRPGEFGIGLDILRGGGERHLEAELIAIDLQQALHLGLIDQALGAAELGEEGGGHLHALHLRHALEGEAYARAEQR